LYCAYYAVFHLFGNDPFTIYFAHRLGALILISVLLYALLCALFSPLVAWIFSAYFLLLIGDGGFAEYAVRYFVLIPLLLALLAALHKSVYTNGLVLGGFLLSALVRPEFSIAFPLALVALVAHDYFTGKIKKFGKRERVIYTATIALALIISVLLVIQTTQTSGRSWLAFGQHYAVGYGARHPEMTQNAWLHWTTYLETSFGEATSVAQALLANPKAFAEHVGWNIGLVPATIDSALKPAYALSSPIAGSILRSVNFSYALLFAVVLAGIFLTARSKAVGTHLLHLGKLWLVVACSLLPVLLASIVIVSSPHYMFVLKAAALLPVGILLQQLLDLVLRRTIQNWLLPVVFLIVALPFPSPFFPPKPRVIVPVIQALPKIDGLEPYSLIADSAKSFCSYSVPDRCKPIELLWAKNQPADVAQYIEQTNTRIFLTSQRLLTNLSPPWLRFAHQLGKEPEQVGWHLVAKTPLFHIYERRISP
jgi:hypothetical protein